MAEAQETAEKASAEAAAAREAQKIAESRAANLRQDVEDERARAAAAKADVEEARASRERIYEVYAEALGAANEKLENSEAKFEEYKRQQQEKTKAAAARRKAAEKAAAARRQRKRETIGGIALVLVAVTATTALLLWKTTPLGYLLGATVGGSFLASIGFRMALPSGWVDELRWYIQLASIPVGIVLSLVLK